MKKIWVDVKGYENLYQVSNYGEIKSKLRYKRNNDGVMLLKPRILKQHPNSTGYYRVPLTDEKGVSKQVFVHRLVAMHFVDNSDAETNNVVNHLDSDHTNNRADNLEWTTIQGNMEHAKIKGRMKASNEKKIRMREALEKYSKSVIGINLKSGETIRFSHLNDSSNEGFQPSCVCNCCKGKRKTHKGYRWQYE